MTRFWVIAPYHADIPDVWERVWRYDLDRGLISIGWSELGDVSAYNEGELRDLVRRKYTDYPPGEVTRCSRMLHNLYQAVKPGHIVIARRGRKTIAAIGTVTRKAYFDPVQTLGVYGPDWGYAHHLLVMGRHTSI